MCAYSTVHTTTHFPISNAFVCNCASAMKHNTLRHAYDIIGGLLLLLDSILSPCSVVRGHCMY